MSPSPREAAAGQIDRQDAEGQGPVQAALAKKLGISQARVAQIESGVGTAKVTFDVLFNMLSPWDLIIRW